MSNTFWINNILFEDYNKNKINTPIILLTAKGEPKERIEGLEMGADDYLKITIKS